MRVANSIKQFYNLDIVQEKLLLPLYLCVERRPNVQH